MLEVILENGRNVRRNIDHVHIWTTKVEVETDDDDIDLPHTSEASEPATWEQPTGLNQPTQQRHSTRVQNPPERVINTSFL